MSESPVAPGSTKVGDSDLKADASAVDDQPIDVKPKTQQRVASEKNPKIAESETSEQKHSTKKSLSSSDAGATAEVAVSSATPAPTDCKSVAAPIVVSEAKPATTSDVPSQSQAAVAVPDASSKPKKNPAIASAKPVSPSVTDDGDSSDDKATALSATKGEDKQSANTTAPVIAGTAHAGSLISTSSALHTSSSPVAKSLTQTQPTSVASGVAASASGTSTQDMLVHRYDSSTPNRLEVGVSGGSLGWVSVCAEVTADGNVHALLRGSAETANVLRAHTDDLATFLNVQAVPVTHISVETTKVSAPVETSSGYDPKQASTNDQGQQQQRSQAENSQGSKSLFSSDESSEDPMVRASLGAGLPTGLSNASTGGWLSVRV